MAKSKAYVETTILANRLTKLGKEKSEAKEALAKYETTELPVYAIKEFKAGVLDYIKYLYNKILDTGSLQDTLIAISSLTAQHNRRATALRLLAELWKSASSLYGGSTLVAKYGTYAEMEKLTYDKVKDDAEMMLYLAWEKRRSVTTNVIHPLSCFGEEDPYEDKKGHICLDPNKCETDNCCMVPEFQKKRFEITKLKVAIDNLPAALKNKSENVKRRTLLDEINRKPGRKISNKDCRNLGDAIFALYCPTDSDILTTNLQDHKPLAEALGKTAISPEEVLK